MSSVVTHRILYGFSQDTLIVIAVGTKVCTLLEALFGQRVQIACWEARTRTYTFTRTHTISQNPQNTRLLLVRIFESRKTDRTWNYLEMGFTCNLVLVHSQSEYLRRMLGYSSQLRGLNSFHCRVFRAEVWKHSRRPKSPETLRT